MSTMTQLYVCSVEDVPLGEGIRIEREELREPIAVFNDEGRFYALSDKCSHAAASLSEGEVKDCQVECPLHWSRFDLATGKTLTLPAVHPVASYPVTVLNGRVYVTLAGAGGE